MSNVRTSKRQNLNLSNADPFERLKELVPVYVVALFSAVAVLIDGIAVFHLLSAQIAVIVLIIIAAILTWWYENKNLDEKDLLQVIVAVVNAVLWLIVINMRFFSLGFIGEFWFRFAAAIWTVIWPIVFNYT